MSVQSSNDIVIIDEMEACPYLSGKTARMPLRMPVVQISPREADLRLAEGHRRTGEFVYQTSCPNCEACEPIRLDCYDFQFSRSQRRVSRRGDREIVLKKGPVGADRQRVDLFNKHRQMRGLAKIDSQIDIEEYIWGFVRSCFSSFEISYWIADRLVGAAVCDEGKNSLSAVYTFYDPEYSRQCIGTYSILKQIEYCRENDLQYLYLGYYIGHSPHMKYKASFRPNERLIDGKWIKFGSLT
ncbi:MAG: arginyltransferase [Mariniblastus sp.]|nr:arginyltransferase [Mariniblastus sp.]